jgi:hypothetical protein
VAQLVFDKGAVGQIADTVSGSGDVLSALTLSARAGGADTGSPAVTTALENAVQIQSAMLQSIAASAADLASGVRAAVTSFTHADDELAKKAHG